MTADGDRLEWLAKILPSSWLTWCLFGFLLILAIVIAGAMAGLVLFPFFGLLLGMDLSVGQMARNGVLDGGFYAMIWAPGVSFVACLMAANWKRQNSKCNRD